ncbi:MAG: DHH family phosphoesterase, partial [Planctomycetes bacterium]|nr:DHH family phosphoesterase [Planctomycetota bacterium]
MSVHRDLTPLRAARFLRIVQRKRSIVILTHNTPDPDAIAGALGLEHLVRQRTHGRTRCVVAYGGAIGRAENKAMIRALGIDIFPAELLDFGTFDLAILVDCRQGTENTALPPRFTPFIEFDHHLESAGRSRALFADIRTSYGAVSTIVTEYLRHARLRVPHTLATALLYGIKVDTLHFTRLAGPRDMDAYLYLFPRADKKLLAEIETPSRSRGYFACYRNAVDQARVHGPAVIVDMGEVAASEIVAEMADAFQRVAGTAYSLVMGRSDGALVLSLRTTDAKGNVGREVKALVIPHGTAGGHAVMAGGKIPLLSTKPADEYRAHAARISRQLIASLGLPA